MTRQDYATPADFIAAVANRFGPIVTDLAASLANTKAAKFYDREVDSLSQPWAERDPFGNLWLNPEFRDIGPWARKCREESAHRDGLIFLLTPASIGTEWFASHVHRSALVLGLSPRIAFEGCADPYPKDLMLSVFGKATSGFDVWRWR